MKECPAQGRAGGGGSEESDLGCQAVAGPPTGAGGGGCARRGAGVGVPPRIVPLFCGWGQAPRTRDRGFMHSRTEGMSW